jgi:predicted RND superfamily exporter protein
MTLLALSLTLLLLLAVTRNPMYAVLGVLPVGLAIGWTSAAMYVFRIPLNPLTSIGGPLVVALGTEFSILLMLRYREERQNGLAPAEAMGQAYILSGRAIAASAFTVMGAFLALVFHPFPLLSQFGSVAVIGVALSFAGAMLVMPPLLVWADETLTSMPEESPQPQT